MAWNTQNGQAAAAKGAVVGAAGGGLIGAVAAGAAVGGMAGPLGASIGALEGAVVGAIAGTLWANTSPTAEDAYWREHYTERPYAAGANFDDYGPAFSYGVTAYRQLPSRAFEEIEQELGRGWSAARGRSTLDWNSARLAARDAWLRLDSLSRSESVTDEGRAR